MSEITPENSGKVKNELIAPDMVTKFWLKFFDAHPNDVARHGAEALKWFRIQVSKFMNLKAERIIQTPEQYDISAPKAQRGMIGKLFLFKYQAEEAGDAESGLYDMYPMVFFFNVVKTKEGKRLLYGLNMHYLLPRERAILYRELMKLKNTKGWTPRTKLKAQWDLIKAVCGSNLQNRAVHAYRVDRIKSRMVDIPASDWIVCVFLRIERFVKAEDHSSGLSPSGNRKSVQMKGLKKPKL